MKMPEHKIQTKDQSTWINFKDDGSPLSYISESTAQRNYNELLSFNIDVIGDVKIMITKRKGMAGVFIPDIRPEDGAKIYYVACLVYFKHKVIDELPDFLHGKEQLQIDRVATVPELEGLKLATHVYSTLTEHGYVVVSDTVQYEGGKRLWKKLSLEKQINVFIYDRETKDVFRDKSDQPIKYNSLNIPDEQIWLTGKPGQRFLLIAHK